MPGRRIGGRAGVSRCSGLGPPPPSMSRTIAAAAKSRSAASGLVDDEPRFARLRRTFPREVLAGDTSGPCVGPEPRASRHVESGVRTGVLSSHSAAVLHPARDPARAGLRRGFHSRGRRPATMLVVSSSVPAVSSLAARSTRGPAAGSYAIAAPRVAVPAGAHQLLLRLTPPAGTTSTASRMGLEVELHARIRLAPLEAALPARRDQSAATVGMPRREWMPGTVGTGDDFGNCKRTSAGGRERAWAPKRLNDHADGG
jgi:hypothetical protein